ncbi:MAG: sporulation protein, partial [Bacteroidota bacterium]
MFGKVKQWLGIEGVKLELVLPEKIVESDGEIQGKLRLYSMHRQTVKRIIVKLIERYTRGRRKDRLTDEYELGYLELDGLVEVPAEQMVEVDFTLPFQTVKSDMDEL